ncbi:MAG: phosphoribosylamine--glycine ligase [Chloroflexota bacterium]
MNVLLVGSGGREHALAWKLRQSPLLDDLLIAPGNPGAAQVGRCVPVEATAVEALVDLARRERVGLVVVGPEAPLAAGLADACAAAGIPVFGPSAAAARIESSKAFAKRLMAEAGIPTAAAQIFERAEDAAEFVRSRGRPWVVKADGLAAGKGVIVAETVAETLEAVAQLAATDAGRGLVLEERLRGPEVSLIALSDGADLCPLPPAQDHKRLLDGDRGPNTGGMGAYAPAPHLSPQDAQQVADVVMRPALRALAAAGTPFRGALYAGLILTEHGPRVLEFNARFGDPETQALMPLIDGDLLPALLACARGGDEQRRPLRELLRWAGLSAACVVLAASGYSDAPRRGDVITGVEAVEGAQPEGTQARALVFHAGTAREQGRLVTAGGRVLGVTGIAPTLPEALERAYAAVRQISFEGMQYRTDIGRSAL